MMGKNTYIMRKNVIWYSLCAIFAFVAKELKVKTCNTF